MGDAGWLSQDARRRVRDCIVALEATTGIEVVATVSVSSGHYRHADYLAGAVFSFVSLLFYLFYPEPLFDDVAVVIVVASFGVGAIFSSAVVGLRRLLVSRRLMEDAVRTAARARFVDQRISCTGARTGMLVYVSLFERRVEVVADVGIPVERLGERWTHATGTLQAAAVKGIDPFLAALSSLGPLLTEAVPRASDDINELPDEMVRA